MPKVNRNKQHTDFSLLLSELQEKDKDTGNTTLTSNTKALPTSNGISRNRNTALSNPEIQFAIVTSGKKQTLHDKTCKQLREIADEKIKFIKAFPQQKYSICNVCHLLICLRIGAKDKNKGKEYKTFFKKANATNDLIFKTYIDYKLQTRIQNESTIIVWSKEDTWKIEITSQYGDVILWHNNYYIAKDGKRKTLPEFHNQFPNEPGLKFSKAINCIAKYSPSYHIEQKELGKIEPSILIVIHHLKQEEKQRSTIIGAFLYRIKLTLYTKGYHSHSKLKQTIQEFHIVRTPNETPNENGRYCIVYKSNTVYAYNIGVFDTQKQSFTKSYSKDLITTIANVVAWKKL